MSKRKNSHLQREHKPWVDPPVHAASEAVKAELERRGVTNVVVVADPRQYDWLKELEPREGIDFVTVPPARLRGGGR